MLRNGRETIKNGECLGTLDAFENVHALHDQRSETFAKSRSRFEIERISEPKNE